MKDQHTAHSSWNISLILNPVLFEKRESYKLFIEENGVVIIGSGTKVKLK